MTFIQRFIVQSEDERITGQYLSCRVGSETYWVNEPKRTVLYQKHSVLHMQNGIWLIKSAFNKRLLYIGASQNNTPIKNDWYYYDTHSRDIISSPLSISIVHPNYLISDCIDAAFNGVYEYDSKHHCWRKDTHVIEKHSEFRKWLLKEYNADASSAKTIFKGPRCDDSKDPFGGKPDDPCQWTGFNTLTRRTESVSLTVTNLNAEVNMPNLEYIVEDILVQLSNEILKDAELQTEFDETRDEEQMLQNEQQRHALFNEIKSEISNNELKMPPDIDAANLDYEPNHAARNPIASEIRWDLIQKFDECAIQLDQIIDSLELKPINDSRLKFKIHKQMNLLLDSIIKSGERKGKIINEVVANAQHIGVENDGVLINAFKHKELLGVIDAMDDVPIVQDNNVVADVLHADEIDVSNLTEEMHIDHFEIPDVMYDAVPLANEDDVNIVNDIGINNSEETAEIDIANYALETDKLKHEELLGVIDAMDDVPIVQDNNVVADVLHADEIDVSNLTEEMHIDHFEIPDVMYDAVPLANEDDVNIVNGIGINNNEVVTDEIIDDFKIEMIDDFRNEEFADAGQRDEEDHIALVNEQLSADDGDVDAASVEIKISNNKAINGTYTYSSKGVWINSQNNYITMKLSMDGWIVEAPQNLKYRNTDCESGHFPIKENVWTLVV
jgi:hypothetical protein